MNPISRRHFLHAALVGAAATSLPLLPGCQSVDQYFTADSVYLTDRVVILGGGAAGLAAAYHLKKYKVPYCLFEAHSQFGGRVATLSGLNDSKQHIELGADYFEQRHQTLFDLCRELGLKLKEVSAPENLESQLFWSQGRAQTLRQILPQWQRFFKRISQIRLELFAQERSSPFAKASVDMLQKYDLMSLADLMKDAGSEINPEVREGFLQGARSAWGVEPGDLSALQFLYEYDLDSPLYPLQRGARYQVMGGNQMLTETLFERIESPVPNFTVKFEHELIAIRPRTLFNELIFKTPRGERSFFANRVICTLPLTALKGVDGWEKPEAPGAFLRGIRELKLAPQSKFAFQYAQRFWQNGTSITPAFSGRLLGQVPFQSLYEGTLGQEGSQGILVARTGGKSVHPLTEKLVTDSEQFLAKNFIESAKNFEGRVTVLDWSKKKYIQGGVSYYSPGQFLRYGRLWGQEPFAKDFVFAGEHTSMKWRDTVNGALETGLAAAAKFTGRG